MEVDDIWEVFRGQLMTNHSIWPSKDFGFYSTEIDIGGFESRTDILPRSLLVCVENLDRANYAGIETLSSCLHIQWQWTKSLHRLCSHSYKAKWAQQLLFHRMVCLLWRQCLKDIFSPSRVCVSMYQAKWSTCFQKLWRWNLELFCPALSILYIT